MAKSNDLNPKLNVRRSPLFQARRVNRPAIARRSRNMTRRSLRLNGDTFYLAVVQGLNTSDDLQPNGLPKYNVPSNVSRK